MHRVNVFLIGTGRVGGVLLRFLGAQAPVLRDTLGLELALVGVANLSRMAWHPEGIPYDEVWQRHADGDPTDRDVLLQHLVEADLRPFIVVDATANETVARWYPALLERGIAVVTPNKRSNTLDLDFYRRLRQAARRGHVPFLYETTVGAGLPVISTLRDLLRAGDRITKIEGVFSGTLAYVFNALHTGRSFSAAVAEARERGYTEPDPRDDLSGTDVARKLLILGREMGLQAEFEDVHVESLVPGDLLEGSVSAFMEGLGAVDVEWERRVLTHRARAERLQYVGVIEHGSLSVGVRFVGVESPFYNLKGTDNMISYTTQYYNQTPLVVQGPGAGPEVTAAGVLADVIRAAEYLV